MEGLRPYLYRLSQIRRAIYRENPEDEDQDQPGMLPDDIEDDRCFSGKVISATEIDSKFMSSYSKAREIGLSSAGRLYSKVGGQIPSTFHSTDAYFDSRVYNAQFSPDGDMLYCSSQREIRIYNTEDIHHWKLDKQIEGHNINWTITDIDLSPDQEYLLYTTLEPQINLINISGYDTSKPKSKHIHRSLNLSQNYEDLGIYSAKFSGDGKEIVAGTSNESIVLYDLFNEKEIYRVPRAHSNDINTVCFANRENSQVIFTGSDDTSIRIWDRRTMGNKSIPEGVMIGHREGITHISSKGDGYSLISNCKDQTIKLWDIRKMSSFNNFKKFFRSHPYYTRFDYRWWRYPLENYTKRLAEDSSLLTFRGHSVLSTLIRCYFSPSFTTGQRFIITGSADGRVYIYDSVTGKQVKILNPDIADTVEGPGPYPIVRDVSWHPHLPAISATAFDGNINYYYN